MQHGKTKLMLSAADLFINEPPYVGNISYEEHDLPANAPKQLGRPVKSTDYRKLPWTVSEKSRSSTLIQETHSTASARKSKKKLMSSVVSAEQEDVTKCIRMIKSAQAHRINLESRSILVNGHIAWKHANDVKVKLGTSCIFFNNPEFFKRASKAFAKEYELKCTQQEKRREDWERTRNILQRASDIYKAGRLCAPSKKSEDNQRCLSLSKLIENRQSSGNIKVNTLLFASHPWKKSVKGTEIEENDYSGLSDTQTSMIEVFDDAERLISKHLRGPQERPPIELLPIVLPKLTET
ncbi:hypothetical protein Aperf_G00000068598 [Anoplocephala perfoliata]